MHRTPILEPEASARLREQLLAELKDIASADDAAIWAHRILGAKNTLTAADARMIEDAFQARLIILGGTANADIIDAPLPPVASEISGEFGARTTWRAIGFQQRSTRAAWPTRNRAAFVTRTTSSLSPSSRVLFAADDHRMGIICASPSTAPSAAR